MKTEWVCTWSLIPASEKYVEKYSSAREAKTAMAQRIAEYFDLKPYLNRMRKEKDPDYKEAADYLEKFLSCLSFEECAEYSMPGLSGPVECYGYEDEFSWSCDYQHCPFFSARESSYDDEPGLFIGFCYQNPPKVKTPQVTGINIHIVERIDYGGSANPFLVLWALGEDPRTQNQISKKISEQWDASIERKAVGRHLQLLQDLGFPVQHCPEGYYCGGEPGEPRTDIQYNSSAYPFLILQVLDCTPKTQTAIIKEIQRKYGNKIDRKAVVRNLELLNDLGYKIQRSNGGYYISK